MSTRRYLVIGIAIALAALAALSYREGLATRAIAASPNQAAMDSATRSYTGWAQAAELNRIDSATRSYTGWAKSVSCDPAFGLAQNLDSATRSYTAWAKSLECDSQP